MSNYIISYDLQEQGQARGLAPRSGQNYAGVEEAINRAGVAIKFLETVWYLKSDLEIEPIRDAISKVMDDNDKLLVILADRVAGEGLPRATWGALLNIW